MGFVSTALYLQIINNSDILSDTAACVDGLFAVSGIWAGCGDIIFTRCVGPSAFARSTTVSW